ncbi:MAG: hypothetical protein ABSF69_15995 [Polyangiaceae bacterium]
MPGTPWHGGSPGTFAYDRVLDAAIAEAETVKHPVFKLLPAVAHGSPRRAASGLDRVIPCPTGRCVELPSHDASTAYICERAGDHAAMAQRSDANDGHDEPGAP